MSKLDYERVLNTLVNETATYLTKNNLQAMVLGISGGIDSTVVAAICHEVSKQTGIPLIGRSLPIKNKSDEFDVSKLVGEAFCDDFKVCPMTRLYHAALKEVYQVENMERHESTCTIEELEQANGQTKVANGNIQARLRMMFLYNLASIHRGLVMSTDNQTEYQLGFWTIHGDVGDFDPIQDLWKTEVYELATYISERYALESCEQLLSAIENNETPEIPLKVMALQESIALTPTDGLGISNSDLDQIGAKDYATVDDILSRLIPFEEYRQNHGAPLHPHDEMAESDCWSQLCVRHGKEVVDKVWARHKASAFKREKSPMYICRSWYE